MAAIEKYKKIYFKYKHNKIKFLETFMKLNPDKSKLTAQRVWYKCREEDPKPSRRISASRASIHSPIKPDDRKLLILKFKKEVFEEAPEKLEHVLKPREIKWVRKEGILNI